MRAFKVTFPEDLSAAEAHRLVGLVANVLLTQQERGRIPVGWTLDAAGSSAAPLDELLGGPRCRCVYEGGDTDGCEVHP